MPSFPHDFLADLFRNRLELARELLRACAGLELPGTTAEVGTIDMSQVAPPQYFADFVVALNDGPTTVAAVIVEVQLDTDPIKLFSWPVYLAVARSRLRCPVSLLVVAPDPAVARWARQAIDVGHPGFSLRPIVVSYDDVPRVTDPEQAARMPELSVLSVLAHPELEVARAAVHAVRDLDETRGTLYLDVINAALPDALRTALEEYMEYSNMPRPWSDARREEGREQGRVLEARSNLCRVLEARGITIEPVARVRIDGENDLATLERWLVIAVTAGSLDEVLREP